MPRPVGVCLSWAASLPPPVNLWISQDGPRFEKSWGLVSAAGSRQRAAGSRCSHAGVRIALGRKQEGEDWIRLTVRDQGPLGCPGEDQFPDYLASHDPRGSHRRRKADSSRRRALGLRGAGSGDAHATVVVVAVLVVLVFGRDRPALGLRPDRSDNGQILPGIILSFQQRWRGLLAGSPWGVQGDLGCADRGLLSLDLL